MDTPSWIEREVTEYKRRNPPRPKPGPPKRPAQARPRRQVSPYAEQLRATLAREGRSQIWLASELGVSPNYVSNILNGHQPWTSDFADKVSARLGPPNSVQPEDWKANWIMEHGPSTLAVLAEQAWQQAIAKRDTRAPDRQSLRQSRRQEKMESARRAAAGED